MGVIIVPTLLSYPEVQMNYYMQMAQNGAYHRSCYIFAIIIVGVVTIMEMISSPPTLKH